MLNTSVDLSASNSYGFMALCLYSFLLLFYGKICKPLGFVENQAILSGAILGVVTHLCAKTQKIIIFPMENDNK